MTHRLVLLLAVVFCCTSGGSLVTAQQPTETVDVDCLRFFFNKTVSWLAVWHGYAGAGTAYYAPNGTLATWDPHGKLVNHGTYTVKRGSNGWCYEYERYDYPPGASPTCNTFRLLPSVVPEDTVMIGCEVFGDKCYDSCDRENQWKDWYVARVVA